MEGLLAGTGSEKRIVQRESELGKSPFPALLCRLGPNRRGGSPLDCRLGAKVLSPCLHERET